MIHEFNAPDNLPAFPQHADTGNLEGWRHGMTLRDYFAANALPMAWAVECERPTGPYTESMLPTYAGAATRAYLFADAMLNAREAK